MRVSPAVSMMVNSQSRDPGPSLDLNRPDPSGHLRLLAGGDSSDRHGPFRGVEVRDALFDPAGMSPVGGRPVRGAPNGQADDGGVDVVTLSSCHNASSLCGHTPAGESVESFNPL